MCVALNLPLRALVPKNAGGDCVKRYREHRSTGEQFAVSAWALMVE
jgi:hypothetical protein